MKNNLRKYALAALFVCLICSLAFVACKKNPDAPIDNSSKPPIEEVNVVLSDSVLTMDINDTATLTVIEGGSGNLKWESGNTAVATVDDNGTVTAIAEGTAEIEVTTANGKATCTVLVVNSYVAPVLTVSTDEIALTIGDDYLLLPKLIYKGHDCTAEAQFGCTVADGEKDSIVTVEKNADGFLFTAQTYGATKYVVHVEYAGVALSAVVNVSVIDAGIVFDVVNIAPTTDGYCAQLSTYAIGDYVTAITPVVNVIEKGQTTNNAEISYTTDNERVATVVDGKIVAVDAGTTKVRGTYKESGFIINVTVDKPVLEAVATNGVVEVGRLADVAFDIPLEGSLVSATIGNAQVGKSITDGMLTLDREKLEAMPVANYGEHVALFIETNLVKYSTEIELYTLVVKNKQDYMSIGSLSKAACKNNDKLFGGYFVFADNITVDGGMSEFIDRTKTDFNGNGSEGFCGIIDGRGYVISGLTKTTDNGNAFISVMHTDGVLKNLGFIHSKFETDSGSFLVHTGAGTVENVYVQYDKISGGSPEGYSGTIFNANLSLNKMVVDVTNAQISGNGSKFALMTANRHANLKNFICLFGNNYTLQDVIDGKVTVENEQDFTNDDYKRAFDNKVFFGFAALQQSEFFTSMSEWNGNLWHIDVDEGKIDFGVKEYVEPEFRYETINVQESDRVRAELDINNNGTLNNGKIIDIDIANIIGTSDYTLVSVNGNGAASNNVTADLFGYLYGNQTVQIVVDAEDARYTINLPMLLVSKVIRTVDDYAAWVKIAIACENNGKTEGSHNYGGYFELGNDIKSESGSIPMAYADQDAWDGAGGFSGTFDGCGYVIDGLEASVAKDHATFVGEMKPDAVLKNIGFTNVKMSGVTLLTRTQNGTISNIYVQYKKIAVTSGQTLLARDNAIVENIFVDASAAEIVSGSAYAILGSRHAEEKQYSIYGIVPQGCVSYVDRGTSGCGHGFASTETLKSDDAAWRAVRAFETACNYWHIDTETGEVTFGK